MPPQKKIIKNRPKTEGEILDSKIEPYDQNLGKPDIHKYKRGNDSSLRGEEIKNISVEIEDIDSAVLYYFQEVIKPYVVSGDGKYNVPVMFADPERWKSAQKDGNFRDKDGRVMFPVITLRRDNMEKNRSITTKLDGNVVNIYNVYEKKYSQKNQYDNFSILTNREPVKEFYNIVVPDYYTITYSCAIYVSFLEDMNKLIEAIGFRSDSYWGQPSKFLFKCKIDNFPVTAQLTDGEDRKFMSTFSIVLNGYLTPNNIDRFLASDQFKYRSKSQIIFTMEASNQDVENVVFSKKPNVKVAKTSYIPEGVNVTNITNYGSGINNAIISYLNTNKTIVATYMTGDRAEFLNSSILQTPTGSTLPATSVSDFKFFVNGVYVDAENIVSFQNSGSSTVLNVNTGSLGYNIDSLDYVIAVGKFA